MIGRQILTPEHEEWNARWGAPHGRAMARLIRRIGQPPLRFLRVTGPFSVQPNSSTRRIEYPWAADWCEPLQGSTIVDIGAGFSGLPYVLAKGGAKVTVVDPFADYGPTSSYRAASPRDVVARMNRVLRTDVSVEVATLAESSTAPATVDRALCISVIEHLDDEARLTLIQDIERVLKPGGRAILTVDLFLDTEPFTSRPANRYGRNISIKELVEATNLELVFGDRNELYGYPEFSAEDIISRRDAFAQGRYPVLAQCLVLQKSGRPLG